MSTLVTDNNRYDNDSMTHTFKKINERFTKGVSGDVQIIFMNMNNYVNCSKICNAIYHKLYGDNPVLIIHRKTISEWIMDEKNQDLIEDAERKTDLTRNDLMIRVDIPELKGTYVHPCLTDHIIVWAGGKDTARYTKMVREFMLLKKEDEIMNLFVKKHAHKLGVTYNDLVIENNNLRIESAILREEVLDNTKINVFQAEILRLREELLNAHATINILQQTFQVDNNSSDEGTDMPIKSNPAVRIIKENERRSISPPRFAVYKKKEKRENSVPDTLFRSKSVNIVRRKDSSPAKYINMSERKNK